MKKWITTKNIEGHLVSLELLEEKHANELLEAASDGELWNLWFTSVPDSNTIKSYIKTALNQFDESQSVPFIVRHKESQKIIGSTRFCNIDNVNKRLEIGYTWYAKSFQKTGVNTECKYLLLKHAFEECNAIAVEFRTHWYNENSRRAILRLGAKQDGILRHHKYDKKGNMRDTVVFSIIREEWEGVKGRLEEKMGG